MTDTTGIVEVVLSFISVFIFLLALLSLLGEPFETIHEKVVTYLAGIWVWILFCWIPTSVGVMAFLSAMSITTDPEGLWHPMNLLCILILGYCLWWLFDCFFGQLGFWPIVKKEKQSGIKNESRDDKNNFSQ